jgi:ankyrin repeat protein
MNARNLLSQLIKNPSDILLYELLSIFISMNFGTLYKILFSSISPLILPVPLCVFIVSGCFLFNLQYLYSLFIDNKLVLWETLLTNILFMFVVIVLKEQIIIWWPIIVIMLATIIISRILYSSLEDKLYYAILTEHKRIVENIIERGADINAKYESGNTPLICAISAGQLDIVKILIENGADINAKYESGNTPLIFAIFARQLDIIKIFIENGADINFESAPGVTPLNFAVGNDNIDIVKILIENGADINAKSEAGFTPLMYAIATKKLDIVKILIENGADISAKDESGNTPLLYAIVNKKLDIVKILIENGADINFKGKDGYTPLHAAVETQQLGISLALIENNANINQKAIDGFTPLHYAVHKQQYEIVVTLLNNGADINAEDKEKESPLDFATQRADQDMINILNTPIKDLERQYLHILIKNNMLVMALELIQKIKLEEQDIIAIKDINNRTSNLIKEQYEIANKTSHIEENKQSLAKAICGHNHKSTEADTQFKLGMFSLKNKIGNCHLTAYKVFNYLGKFTNESKIKLNILSYAGIAPINIQEFTSTIPTKADEVNKSNIQMLFRNNTHRSFYNVNPGFYKP